ncbi:MAG: metal-dependent hydrolase [Deltaproteobacteria bacterium]|nr:metal-dependent hydrolase [Deltaproteobacteria bacterium]
MTRPTHLLGGLAVGTLFTVYGMPFAVLGALLPDIDRFLYKESSEWSIWGHRGFTHTILFGYLLSLFIYHYLGGIMALAFLFGVLSHIVLDSFNYKAEEPFFPFKFNVHFDIVKVGTWREYLFFTAPLFFITLLLFYHFNEGERLLWLLKRLSYYRYY